MYINIERCQITVRCSNIVLFTITDVTSNVHQKLSVSSCTSQPKRLNQIITVNSSIRMPQGDIKVDIHLGIACH